MEKKRKRFSAEEKVKVLRRHPCSQGSGFGALRGVWDSAHGVLPVAAAAL
jgi:hypothetical protein